MSHIIALQGVGSSGKTSTLLQVFIDLQAKYPNSKVQIMSRRTDVKVLMQGINGKTIGIETQGDPNSRLQESLSDFLAAKCDIIFCACRTSGMTVTWVNALSAKHNVQFVQQTRVASGHAKSNSAMAKYLIMLAGL